MKDKSVSKSIRLPSALCERLERAAKEKGSSFSATVIDILEHGSVVVVSEGSEIAALLFEISRMLREGSATDGNGIGAATERLVDCITAIHERYLEGGKIDGNP